MSTRSVIARVDGQEGGFKGVYHHWDGSPTWLGKKLWSLLNGQFKGNLNAMLTYLIDQHSAGWSSLESSENKGKPECYCHPKRQRAATPQANWYTHENVETDIEYVYAFDEEQRRLYVRVTRHDAEEIIDLDGDEPDWGKIQCGAELERCSHYAWVHFPKLKGSSLGTATYLGRREFSFHDAVAIIKDGKRFKLTGSGSGRSGVWVSTAVTRNGRRLEIPTALYDKEAGYLPYPGVAWVFPPTQDNPNETIKEYVA
jgi:hypothetical protein